MEYQKFRVKSTVKSFRDLEVYKKTTEFSTDIFNIALPENLKNKKLIEKELETLGEISKHIPRLIAEAYGDRFTDKELGFAKMEKAAQVIADIVSKMDFLISLTTSQELKELLVGMIFKYQAQKRKILNLKNAWERISLIPREKNFYIKKNNK